MFSDRAVFLFVPLPFVYLRAHSTAHEKAHDSDLNLAKIWDPFGAPR